MATTWLRPDMILGAAPPEVRAAWEAHRPHLEPRTLAAVTAHLETLVALKTSVRRAARRLGYYRLDGYLVGFGGFGRDPHWSITREDERSES